MSLDELSEPSDLDEGPATTPTALQHLDEHTQENVSAIDEALQRLERVDKQQAQIIEMRYFGGLTIEQTAEALSISPATVKREWTLARAWLKRELAKAM
jgi:RNA polymerase sigma factor (sigma-70 family)